MPESDRSDKPAQTVDTESTGFFAPVREPAEYPTVTEGPLEEDEAGPGSRTSADPHEAGPVNDATGMYVSRDGSGSGTDLVGGTGL